MSVPRHHKIRAVCGDEECNGDQGYVAAPVENFQLFNDGKIYKFSFRCPSCDRIWEKDCDPGTFSLLNACGVMDISLVPLMEQEIEWLSGILEANENYGSDHISRELDLGLA